MEYYVDIETHCKTGSVNPKEDSIIAITYQKMSCQTGDPKGELVILKAWETSEEEILRKFDAIFNTDNKWGFVAVGFNLRFDFISLLYRWKHYGIKADGFDIMYGHPQIDLQATAVLCNRGMMKGASLEAFAGKANSGGVIKELYEEDQYDLITRYIEDETS